MKKTKIDWKEYVPWIIEQLPQGILLTGAADGKVNTMTIGWGQFGIEWGKNLATVYVRQSRYTKKFLDKNPEFTLNIPLKDSDVRRIMATCGTRSGRDYDKFSELGLTTVPGSTVSVPGIVQLPITLECRIIYRQDQDPAGIPADIKKRFYATGDYHTMYCGEIVDAYIIEED